MARYKLMKRLVQVNPDGTQKVHHTSKIDYTESDLNGIKTLEAIAIKRLDGNRLEYRFNPGSTISGLPA